jgi:phosphosulfolactate synthase
LTRAHDAFAGVIADPLAGRSSKPRHAGQTMVIDKGMGLGQTGDLLELGAPYIDYIKSCSNWVPK